MTDYQVALLVTAGLKGLYTLAGLATTYMGFSLFVRGVQKGGAGFSADADHKAGGWKAAVAIDKGGPGLLFALFGAAITIVGIAKPVSVLSETKGAAHPNPAPIHSEITPRPATTTEAPQVASEAQPAPPADRTALIRKLHSASPSTGKTERSAPSSEDGTHEEKHDAPHEVPTVAPNVTSDDSPLARAEAHFEEGTSLLQARETQAAYQARCGEIIRLYGPQDPRSKTCMKLLFPDAGTE